MLLDDLPSNINDMSLKNKEKIIVLLVLFYKFATPQKHKTLKIKMLHSKTHKNC